jgi:hypothetical protein
MSRFCCLLAMCTCLYPAAAVAGVPVIYSTDLYHPHDDPDDHFDLATLFALPELDVKGIIIDMANIRQQLPGQGVEKKPGVVALQQMFHLSGRKVPYTTGLDRPLKSMDDQARDQSDDAQGGVRMILATLRESQEKVCIFTVGSLRDVAAAYNREPDLLRTKVRGIYANVGTGPDGYQEEWNVGLDQQAYRRVMLSELPVQWYPCFGRDGYFTYFVVDQTKVLENTAAPLRAYFDYALTRSTQAPIPYLSKNLPAPSGPRNMWCTASFIELAGRRIYQTDKGFETLAQPPRAGAMPVVCYNMRPVRLTEISGEAVSESTQGAVVARYLGCTKDLVGKTSLDPDGTPDCLVSIQGLSRGKTVRSATLTGPREGVWLSYTNPRRWLLKTVWENDSLMLAFTYWAPGRHQLDMTFDDDTKASVTFAVPVLNAPYFQADLQVSQSNVRVIHKQEPEYTKVMSSCLQNILESYPLVEPPNKTLPQQRAK